MHVMIPGLENPEPSDLTEPEDPNEAQRAGAAPFTVRSLDAFYEDMKVTMGVLTGGVLQP